MQDVITTTGLDPLSTQVVASAVFAYLLEKAKNSKLIPWINCDSSKLNRVIAVITSGLGAVGVHLSVSHGANGTWGIVATGLQWSTIWVSGVSWLKSFIIQELIYQKMIKTTATPVVIEPVAITVPATAAKA